MGYQSLFIVDIEGFLLGHVEASVNVNDKMRVESLLDELLCEDIEIELATTEANLARKRDIKNQLNG